MKQPTRDEEAKIALLIIMIGLMGAGQFLFSLILSVGIIIWQMHDWLNEGWVKNSKLEEARDAAMRMPLLQPGRLNGHWAAWATKVEEAMKEDPLPGDLNSAVYSYLLDEHDAERMEYLLNIRVWPKGSCACERDTTHPWKFNHVISCRHHPDYTDAIFCCCIKKRRKGKTKVYRSLECPVHTTDAERKVAEEEAEDPEQQTIKAIQKRVVELQRVPPHDLGPRVFNLPIVKGTTPPSVIKDYVVLGGDQSQLRFSCGCYAIGDFDNDYNIVSYGMCSRNHEKDIADLFNKPMFPSPEMDEW